MHSKFYGVKSKAPPRPSHNFWCVFVAHLLVPRANFAVKVEGLASLAELPAVQQVGADHDARAALPGLAVDGGHVLLIAAQPRVQVLAEGLDQLQLRRVVVLERELGHWGARGTRGALMLGYTMCIANFK